MNFLFRTIVGIGCFVALVGCEAKSVQGEAEDRAGFAVPAADAVTSVVLDVSGSFDDKMLGVDCPAFKFTGHLLQEMQQQGVGYNSRLQISVICGRTNPVVFDGTFRDFKSTFRDVDAFRTFIKSKVDNGGSRVHDTVRDAIDFALESGHVVPGVTKLGLFVVSDFEDTFGDTTTLPRLEKSLQRWAERKGVVGFYWVDNRFRGRWTNIVGSLFPMQGNMKRGIVSTDATVQPDIPVLLR